MRWQGLLLGRLREGGAHQDCRCLPPALAHCMTRIVSGILTGKNKQYSVRSSGRGEAWTKRIFSCKDESGAESDLQFYLRLEFYGSRKEPTQAYHGIGLVWLSNAENTRLDKAISATAPDGTLGAYVRGSQEDRDGDSKRECRGRRYGTQSLFH